MSGLLGAPAEVVVRPLVERSLREDLGLGGDVTTDSIIAPEVRGRGTIRARTGGCIAGLKVAALAFRILDSTVKFQFRVEDGEVVEEGADLLELEGSARAILSGERTALNFLGHLSGIATTTHNLVQMIEGTGARLAATRKTTPGLAALEKYAVRCGGGADHRFGLYDAILIKDNHIALAGGVRPAVERARARAGHLMPLELEVDSLAQLREGLELHVERFLLDNFSLGELREAVAIVKGRALLEASGGINPETVCSIAETGVDVLSLGWLTHSAPNLDVGLDIGELG